MRLNSVGRKEVSFLFDRIAAQSVRHQYIIKSARSTWNFVRQQATLAQGSASEAHLNMDVNMRRLPELMKDAIEILSAPAGFMLVLERIDCAIIRVIGQNVLMKTAFKP